MMTYVYYVLIRNNVKDIAGKWRKLTGWKKTKKDQKKNQGLKSQTQPVSSQYKNEHKSFRTTMQS